jgi:hypothetical protein
MAPNKARQQQPRRQQQQQQQLRRQAASEQQSLVLLQRLSEAPDLSLFKEKSERVQQSLQLYHSVADDALVMLRMACACCTRCCLWTCQTKRCCASPNC